ncbi:prolyl hydroxylase EGLN3 [Takifugu rubripes]|uniref:hypoxia-inducible factor-proline dioxygenase n=1 Tax=Takifugu rubripes TaxID=31033 RepID=A0A3B5KID2_TAKRU|nr:egl nine homolog 3 [Takifugu rubripes]
MPFIEPLSDANLEHLALEQIVPALLSHGFYYVDGLLGDLAGGAVLDQVKEMHRSGKLQDGRLAGSAPGIHRRSIRGDKIAWVSGSERGCEAVSLLLNLMDKLVSLCARRLGGRTIGERSQAMVACYPGNGAGYIKHVDNPNRDGRCVTCIYYLNKSWTEEHGGVLRIFPEGKSYVADVSPLFDRLLFFWSDRRNPHEVQPSYATRYAITVWYFDSVERAEAKRRFRAIRGEQLQLMDQTPPPGGQLGELHEE